MLITLLSYLAFLPAISAFAIPETSEYLPGWANPESIDKDSPEERLSLVSTYIKAFSSCHCSPPPHQYLLLWKICVYFRAAHLFCLLQKVRM